MTTTRAALFETLETYYDTVPRASTRTEEVGPFTLFLKSDPAGFDYYARPRLGLAGRVTADDVRVARGRLVELGAAENLEWVHETTPSLLAAARAAGLSVLEAPLLVLRSPAAPAAASAALDAGVRVEVLTGSSPMLAAVTGAVHAGFAGTDEVTPQPLGRRARLVEEGLLVNAGAWDDSGALGGGSHSPRGAATELTGIAVVPRARRRGVGAALTAALVADATARGIDTVFLSAMDDAVARIYERVGFERVGTACIASAPPR
ncbi:MAG: GNAT family N-acetyltransferase [Nocardioidaceae bacterium]